MVRDDAYNYLGIVIDSKLNWNYFEAACWGGMFQIKVKGGWIKSYI